jgi:hypothetical protein
MGSNFFLPTNLKCLIGFFSSTFRLFEKYVPPSHNKTNCKNYPIDPSVTNQTCAGKSH